MQLLVILTGDAGIDETHKTAGNERPQGHCCNNTAFLWRHRTQTTDHYTERAWIGEAAHSKRSNRRASQLESKSKLSLDWSTAR